MERIINRKKTGLGLLPEVIIGLPYFVSHSLHYYVRNVLLFNVLTQ